MNAKKSIVDLIQSFFFQRTSFRRETDRSLQLIFGWFSTERRAANQESKYLVIKAESILRTVKAKIRLVKCISFYWQVSSRSEEEIFIRRIIYEMFQFRCKRLNIKNPVVIWLFKSITVSLTDDLFNVMFKYMYTCTSMWQYFMHFIKQSIFSSCKKVYWNDACLQICPVLFRFFIIT
jgi:hypothetical protein